MKKYTKKLLAFLLALAMAVPSVPMNAKAADERVAEVITLDFGRPTTGVYSNRAVDWGESAEAIMQGITGTVPTTDSRTYTLSSELAGTNWRLNADRVIPALAEGETKWPTGNTGFNYFLWGNANSNWGKGKRTVLYLYGAKTISFDFDVTKTAEYQLSLVYYDNSTPRKLNITVDPQSENPFKTQFAAATVSSPASTKMVVEEMAGTVVLTAGTHTVDIQNPQTKVENETCIRAIILTEVLAPIYESSTLNVADVYNVGDVAEVSVTSLFDNGEEITEGISVAYTSSNENAATVVDGVLTALAFGKTTITAEVSYNGEVVETLTKSVKVTVPGAFDIDFTKMDLSTTDTADPQRYYLFSTTTPLEGSGQTWSFNAEKSYKGMLNDVDAKNYGRVFFKDGAAQYVRLMSANKNLVVNFEAPAAGLYDIYMNLFTYESMGYGRVWVNGVNVGAVDGYSGNPKTQKLLTTELVEGTNEITFEAYKKSNGTNYYISIVSVDFVPVEAATNVVTNLEATVDIAEYDMADVVTGQVDATITTTDGSIVFAEFTSNNGDVASVNRMGVITAKKAGEATIIVKAPGVENIEIPVVVNDSRPRYTVAWLNDDGSEIATSELLEGAAIAYKGETPVKEADAQYTYEFAGWVDAEGNPLAEDAVMGTEAVTYTATYTATVNKYIVSFVVDGEVVSAEEYEYGAMPVVPEVADKEDADKVYTFLGWDAEVSAVTGEATYTAVFEEVIQNYTITFADEDGTVLEEITVAPGDVPVCTVTPVKEATAQYTYTFIGWDKEVVAAVGNEIYTAVYEATVNEYTVTWMNFDGTVIATETYEYGATPEYKGDAPVYNDYTFTGWSPAIAVVEGDATYTAQFEMSGKSIEWFDEDGDGVAETGYYYVDGAVKKGAGLVEVDGYLYWVLSTGKIALGTTRTIKENQTNGLIEAGTYYFLSNGILETAEVRLSGEIRWSEENGKQVGYYYVMNEVRKDVGLVEVWNEEAEETTWYYVLFSGKVKRNYVADGKRVNQTVKANRLNKYTGPEGLYSFYENGVMYDPLATESGIVKYDETGKPWYYVDGHIRKDAGLVYVQRGDLAGNYIFVTFSGTLKKGTQSIKDKTCNGHTEFIGTQRFDSNTGAMIIK